MKDQDGKIINKQRYINLLQSQLSDEELCLIFYDAISPYGMNKNGDGIFYKLLEESEMLENINENVLIEKVMQRFILLQSSSFFLVENWL